MSDNTYDSSELSSILEKDSSGRKLAQYLMKKDGAPKVRRLFDNKERRISVQVELLRPEDQEKAKNAEKNNDENYNTQNTAKTPEAVPILPPEQSENIRNENPLILPTTVRSDNIAGNNVDSIFTRSPNRAVARTPELLPRPVFSQTPRSSQRRAPVSSSDRLRRLSFKHLIGGSGAKRVLLNELNATDNSSAFSGFEPALQNKPGCTSTPAMGIQQRNLDNIIATLNKSREYNVEKGAVPGQIILTPSKVVEHQSPGNTASNKTVVRCEQSIELATPDNVNVSYGPRGPRPARFTDHNAVSIILTDDEEDNEPNLESRPNVKEHTQAMILEASVSEVNTARDATFVRPRSPIHKKPAETQSTAQSNVIRPNLLDSWTVSSTQTQDNAGELADDENTRCQSIVQLPFQVQTRVETEIFDDPTPLERVTFRSQETAETTINSRKQQYPKKRNTPDYIRVYRNARKRFKSKPKIFYKNGSKRSLYSMKDDSTVTDSPPHGEVTSTNAVATPARSLDCLKKPTLTSHPQQQTEHNRRTRSSSNFNENESHVSKPTNKSTNAETQRASSHGSSKEKFTKKADPPELTQRRSRLRSRRKTVNKSNALRLSPSSSSSDDQSAVRDQSPLVSRSPSLPTRRVSCRESSTEQSESESPPKPSGTNTAKVPATEKHKAKLTETRKLSKKPSVVSANLTSPAPSRSPSLPPRRGSSTEQSESPAKPSGTNPAKAAATKKQNAKLFETRTLSKKPSAVSANLTSPVPSRSPSLPPRRASCEESSTEKSESDSPAKRLIKNSAKTHMPVKQKAKLGETQTLNQRSLSRSPSLLRRMDHAANQDISETESDMNREPPPLSSPSSTASSPTKRTNSSGKSQSREASPTTVLPKRKKTDQTQTNKTKKTANQQTTGKKRKRSKTKKAKMAARHENIANVETQSNDTSDTSTLRRSKRGPKPIKIEPYAIEIYTRCYFPERYKTQFKSNKKEKSKTGSTNQNTRKRKSDSNNLQPRVKLRRLNLNAAPEEHVDDAGGGGSNVADLIESAPTGINAWLQSLNVTSLDNHSETNPHQYDGHFLSRELLVCERYNDIEFRFYNHPTDSLNLGYIIFKPKAVKKMVTLKHADIKFVCICGEFLFKIKDKDTRNVKERNCNVGDAFFVHKGDTYGIEYLSESENGQIMMIKEKQVEN